MLPDDELGKRTIDRRSAQDTQVESETLAYEGYAQLKQVNWKHRSFRHNDWLSLQRECLVRKEAAALLPYDPKTDQVVLLQQARIGPLLHGHNPWMLEIVAGVADKDGETKEDLVRRETLEESGLTCFNLELIHRYFSSPGCSSEFISVYCGHVDAPKKSGIFGVEEEGEEIKTLIITFDEAMNALQSGIIDNAVTIIALQWLQIHRNELRKKW